MTRRCVTTALSALAVAATSMTAAQAGEPEVHGPSPRTAAYAVAPDRVVVAVDNGGRDELTTAVARDRSGALIGRAVLTRSGKGLIPIKQRPNSRQAVHITYTNGTADQVRVASQQVTLRSDASALRTSTWRVVNKRLPLRPTEAPQRTVTVEGVPLDARAAGAMRSLLQRARAAGLDPYPSNGFRSYAWQRGLYTSYARSRGAAGADAFSARPGYSEHQTGLAFDAKSRREGCDLAACFGQTASGRFLAQHAAASGFVVRYTAASKADTGYQAEPWHLRYVGPWLAGYLREAGKTSLEDAFAMPPAPAY